MTLMLQENTQTLKVETLLVVAFAVAIFMATRQNKLVAILAIIVSIVSLHFGVGYGEYMLTVRQTLDIGVWGGAIAVGSAIIIAVLEILKKGSLAGFLESLETITSASG